MKCLPVTCFASIFSQFVGCLFVLFMVSFPVQKRVSLIWSHLFIFALFLLPWETDLRKHWYNLCQRMSYLSSLLGVLWSHVLNVRLQTILGLLSYMVCGSVLNSLICMSLSSFPSTTCWRDCLLSIEYSCLLWMTVFLFCRHKLDFHTEKIVSTGSFWCSKR